MRGTAIRAGLVAAAATTALAVPWVGTARAGGGMCHAGLTEGEGDTVAMAKACFTPSILRVDPGTEVTFVNKDPITHNVSSNGWGEFGDMTEGDSFAATFRAPGVYPFACTYHPGMVGAVVVGDGTGAGSGEQVTMGSLTEIEDARPAARNPQATGTTPGRSSAVGWIGGGVLGLALGAGLGLVRRRRSPEIAGRNRPGQPGTG